MTTYIPSLTLPHGIFTNVYISTLLPVFLGSAVGFLSRPDNTQRVYATIKQPPFRPPPYIFGPAWTLLYGLMGYAAHRAITSEPLLFNSFNLISSSSSSSSSGFPASAHASAIAGSATLYTIQLGLNLIWMPLFFVLGKPIAATVDILALVGINSYLAWFWGTQGVDVVAGWCMVPYVGWLAFATYLCAGAGYLNGWSFGDKHMGTPERKGQ